LSAFIKISSPYLFSLLKTRTGSEVFYYNSSILSRKYVRKEIIRIELGLGYVIIIKKYPTHPGE